MEYRWLICLKKGQYYHKRGQGDLKRAVVSATIQKVYIGQLLHQLNKFLVLSVHHKYYTQNINVCRLLCYYFRVYRTLALNKVAYF
jgi:hypothetical protein